MLQISIVPGTGRRSWRIAPRPSWGRPTSSTHWNVAHMHSKIRDGQPVEERSATSARFTARHRLHDKPLCRIPVAGPLSAGRDLRPSSAKVIYTPQTPICGRVTRGLAVNGWILWFALHSFLDALVMLVWRATSATLGIGVRQNRTASPVSYFLQQETLSISPSTGCGGYQVRSLVSQHRHTTGNGWRLCLFD